VTVQFPRYVCIHGHFYQPPRENPWLDAVEVQDSAAPYHDWNERITRECYGPNSRSRLVDSSGKIVGLSNNYAKMSFNFGPTLLDWMARGAPDALQGIVEGDRLSQERRSGHGNALAQVFNHVIMPLANERDKRTQVLWGLADFRLRFGREPEGMWLAETAADVASLEALAATGIRFTVLAPRQAKRWRRIGEEAWTSIPEGIDPSRAYLCRLPSGKSITLFFYDGILSRQVAFEGLLDRGETFLSRLMQGFNDSRQHAQLVHIATDGESYGHHHAHGDMALAYVLEELSKNSEIRLTNYGEFLDLHPPEWEAEIHENSSWSCVHGVERWRSHCGCNSGRGWQQEWRGPLRQAFDALSKRLGDLFAGAGSEYLKDPWAARDAYSSVLFDRSEGSVRRFMEQHGRPGMGPAEIRQALWLLEMQRNALLMYTSCGWFFDEISGLETTQCLRYAARAMQLARHFHQDYEQEFVQILEKAPSNLPQFKNGRGVWEQLVRPANVELDRVLAHHAISSIYKEPKPATTVYCYDVETLDQEVRSRGETHLALGRVRARSRLTWNEGETSFVVVHYGGLDFHAVLRRANSTEEYETFKKKLLETYANGSMADLTESVVHDFEGNSYHLADLFREERRRVVGIVLQQRFEDYQQSFERLADQDEAVLNMLGRLHYPIPKTLKLAAGAATDERLRQAIENVQGNGDLAKITQLLERGKAWDYRPAEPEALTKSLEKQLLNVLNDIKPIEDIPKLVARASQILEIARLLGFSLDLWQAQNELLRAYGLLADSGSLTPPLQEALAGLADRLNVNHALLGWRP
jgi:alpha-amylase/alpha-mannosidase (GH57 family)